MSESPLDVIKAEICLLHGTEAGRILGGVVKQSEDTGLLYDALHQLDDANFRLFLELLSELKNEQNYGRDARNHAIEEYIDKAIKLLNIEYYHLQLFFMCDSVPVDVKACCLRQDRSMDRLLSYLKACLVELAITSKSSHAISEPAIASLSFAELVDLHERIQNPA